MSNMIIVEKTIMIKGEKILRNFDEDYSLVRFLHAIPNGDTVDLKVNGISFFNDLDFTQFTPYMYMPKGTYTIEVFNEDTVANPLVKSNIEIDDEELMTIAIINYKGRVKLLLIEDEMEIPYGRQSRVRFVHLVPNGREVDVLLDGDVIFDGVEYTDVTDYVLIDSGEHDVEVQSSLNKEIISQSQIKVNPSRMYTFYAIGEAPNFEVLQSSDGAAFLI